MKQVWGQVKGTAEAKFRPRPIAQSCHFKATKTPYLPEDLRQDDTELDKKMLKLFLEGIYSTIL
jgi:hypothetical protein